MTQCDESGSLFLTITGQLPFIVRYHMPDERMDRIIDALDRERQRATYGAVAALLGKAPRTLMSGRQRDQRHSWIVSRKSGTPSGYDTPQMHPDLRVNERILETRADLEHWLSSVGDLAAVA
jgi:hypothetical protein